MTDGPALLHFNQDVILSKLRDGNGDNAEDLGLGVPVVQGQDFPFPPLNKRC